MSICEVVFNGQPSINQLVNLFQFRCQPPAATTVPGNPVFFPIADIRTGVSSGVHGHIQLLLQKFTVVVLILCLFRITRKEGLHLLEEGLTLWHHVLVIQLCKFSKQFFLIC